METTELKSSSRKPPIYHNQMTNLKDIYEQIDISSESQNDERSERASTPLPKDTFPNIRVIQEISHSSVEANADLEEDLNSSLDSIDMDCKRLKLDNSFETVESGEYPNSPRKYEDGEKIESPESPEECNTIDTTNSGVFIVESHKQTSFQSIDSAIITEYLEQIANEDADSYFVTPPGPLKRINTFSASPLNDLEERREVSVPPEKPEVKNSYGRYPSQPFQVRLPGYAARLMTVALSQSAPGLDCGCRRVGYGRGHGCTTKLAKMYFGF